MLSQALERSSDGLLQIDRIAALNLQKIRICKKPHGLSIELYKQIASKKLALLRLPRKNRIDDQVLWIECPKWVKNYIYTAKSPSPYLALESDVGFGTSPVYRVRRVYREVAALKLIFVLGN